MFGDGRWADGGGLYLRVRRNGSSKAWVFRFTLHGKKIDMGLGSAGAVTLKAARELAGEARAALATGFDPREVKPPSNGLVTAPGPVLVFRQALTDYITLNESRWSNFKHSQQWWNTLDRHAPGIMDMPVDKIETVDVVRALESIWNVKIETARRVRGRIEKVLSYCIALGLRKGPNPAAWKDNLEFVLPKQNRRVKHHAAVAVDEVPAVYSAAGNRTGQGYRLLQFVCLTALRSGEARFLEWADIGDDKIVIPAERMKAGRDHRIPVGKQLAEFLAGLPVTVPLVFPNRHGGACSDMTISMSLKRLDWDATPHGMRACFANWCARKGVMRELAEDQLAHLIGDATERAYRRDDYLERRRAVMEAWAAFVTGSLVDVSDAGRVKG
jgi:integrase